MRKDDLLVTLNAERQITLANSVAGELFGEDLVAKDFVYAIRQPDALC